VRFLRTANTGHAASDCWASWCSYSASGQLPIALWSLIWLYQLGQAKMAFRASARVAKCSPSTTSRLEPEKNYSGHRVVVAVADDAHGLGDAQ
jgi:hypothetical protein